jgi:O-antigen/teichoic acid export membrane protein
LPPLSADALQVRRGVAWVGLASSVVALFDLLATSLLLLFWATKADFGTATTITAVFGALQLLAEGGLPAALIQSKDEPDDARLSTSFWFGIVAAIALYAVLWVVAPAVGRTFGDPVLVDVLRVFGLVLPIRALYTTPQAVLRRHLRFKGIAAVRITANTIEFIVKIAVAAAGHPMWSFIVGPLARELIYAIGLPLYLRWRPRLAFSPRMLVHDLRFGVRANGGEFLFQLYSNLDYLVIRYAWSSDAVGLYRAAYELVLEPVRFLSGIVTVVAFPTFARLRADRAALVDQLVGFLRQNLLVVLPYLAIVVIAAEDCLATFAGSEFAAAGDAARVLTIAAVLRSLSHLGPPLLDGLGRPGLTLRYQITAAVLMTSLFVAIGMWGSSYESIALSWAIGYPFAFLMLGVMVFGLLEVSPMLLVQKLGRQAACIAAAAALGAIAHYLVRDAAPTLRLTMTAAVVLSAGAALLAVFDGFSPRAIVRSLRR